MLRCHGGGLRRLAALDPRFAGHLREAEVENFGVAALGDENICGLDVAMDDAFGVRGVERVGDFDGERSRSPVPGAARRCCA